MCNPSGADPGTLRENKDNAVPADVVAPGVASLSTVMMHVKGIIFPWWTISATCVVSARGMVQDEIDPPVSISKMIQHLNANNMKFDRSVNLITIKSLI